MRIALFVPCYIDQLYPHVGIATLRLLQAQGLAVEVPSEQVCCGQPFTNAGAPAAASGLISAFRETFRSFDTVVCPSASCVSMVRHHYPADAASHVPIYELAEFLHDHLPRLTGQRALNLQPFPHRVAIHHGCHGLRELGLGRCSELGGPKQHSKVAALLQQVPGLELVHPRRVDECCGFGGTFAVVEPEVSAAMGHARLDDFIQSDAEVVTSVDMSCLMHLSGLAKRERKPLRLLHLAEVLHSVASEVRPR